MSKDDQMILRRRRIKFKHSNSTPPTTTSHSHNISDELASEIEENSMEPTTSSSSEYLKSLSISETPKTTSKTNSRTSSSLDVNKRLNIYLEDPDPVELLRQQEPITPLIVTTNIVTPRHRFLKSPTKETFSGLENSAATAKEDEARLWLPHKMGMLEFIWMELTRYFAFVFKSDSFSEIILYSEVTYVLKI